MWKSTMLLASVMLPGVAYAADPNIEQMKQQIETLQRQIQQLESRQVATEEKQKEAFTEDDLKGTMPGSFRIPGTNTSFKIGGTVKLDAMYDFGQAAGTAAQTDILTLDGVPVRDNQFQFNIRHSRINFTTETPIEDVLVRGFLEFDFLGSGGTEASSNSAAPRLRQAMITAGPFTIGQTFTTLYDPLAAAEIFDVSARPGEVSLRQPLIRYTWKDGPATFAVALENPESDFTGDTAANTSRATSLGSVPSPNFDHVPDLVFAYNQKFDWGHLGLQALARQVSVDSGTVEDSIFGFGLGASGSINLAGKDKIQFHGLYTLGGARYFQTGYAGSASFDGSSLNAQDAWGGDVILQHWWTDRLRSNAIVSYMKIDNDDFVVPTANSEMMTFHGNLIATIVPSLDIGLEFIYGRRETADGQEGEVNRLQGSVVYRY